MTKEHDAELDPWRTGITSYDDTHIWFHGHDVTSLMKGASFTDCIFLLHRGRLPTADERQVDDRGVPPSAQLDQAPSVV